MKKILELNHTEARAHLLKDESYFNFNLPPYFVFENLLKDVSALLERSGLDSFYSTYTNEKGKEKKHYPSGFEGVNFKLLSNKDGKFAWRPFQLIHPALYVNLVHTLTEEDNWNLLIQKFDEYQTNPQLGCYSIPLVSESEQSDQASSVLRWWQELEQQSIELALEFDYILHTDIADCYGSIYTHSVPWAFHTKSIAKDRRTDKTLLGNKIDAQLQAMSYGQTNGIPQGSVVMDLIAETVLGSADVALSLKIAELEITDYRIIRYRDDYRIFSNNPEDAEHIAKLLSEILVELGLRLNPNKTVISNRVISNSIKTDKLHYISRKNGSKSLQKHLMLIHKLSEEHPNSGSLVRSLTGYFKRVRRLEEINTNVKVLGSILVDIMLMSPRTYPTATAILSKLFSFVQSDEERILLLEKVQKKFSKVPNTGHVQIWLQRLTLKFEPEKNYDEILCRKVINPDADIWNSDWLKGDLKALIQDAAVVDREYIENMDPVVSKEEFELFKSDYDIQDAQAAEE